jgi:thioredoxin reductase
MCPGSSKLLVLGAGPAGVAAAVEALRLGAEVLLIDARGRPGGNIRLAHEVRNLPFLPARVSGASVARGLTRFLARWGARVEAARVLRVETDADGILLRADEGRLYRGGALVLATGSRAVTPDWAGLAGLPRGRLHASARAACWPSVPARAAVIGGGDVAWDQARYLLARGSRVDVLTRSTHARAPDWLREAALDEGARWCPGTRIQGVRPEGDGLRLLPEEGAALPYDRVVVAMGRVPARPPGVEACLRACPDRVRLAGDVRGHGARHVTVALGQGSAAAFELVTRMASRYLGAP